MVIRATRLRWKFVTEASSTIVEDAPFPSHPFDSLRSSTLGVLLRSLYLTMIYLHFTYTPISIGWSFSFFARFFQFFFLFSIFLFFFFDSLNGLESPKRRKKSRREHRSTEAIDRRSRFFFFFFLSFFFFFLLLSSVRHVTPPHRLSTWCRVLPSSSISRSDEQTMDDSNRSWPLDV